MHVERQLDQIRHPDATGLRKISLEMWNSLRLSASPQRSIHALKGSSRSSGRARYQYELANVLHTGDVPQEALEAQAEAAARERTEQQRQKVSD
jgi:hypothetical protein